MLETVETLKLAYVASVEHWKMQDIEWPYKMDHPEDELEYVREIAAAVAKHYEVMWGSGCSCGYDATYHQGPHTDKLIRTAVTWTVAPSALSRSIDEWDDYMYEHPEWDIDRELSRLEQGFDLTAQPIADLLRAAYWRWVNDKPRRHTRVIDGVDLRVAVSIEDLRKNASWPRNLTDRDEANLARAFGEHLLTEAAPRLHFPVDGGEVEVYAYRMPRDQRQLEIKRVRSRACDYSRLWTLRVPPCCAERTDERLAEDMTMSGCCLDDPPARWSPQERAVDPTEWIDAHAQDLNSIQADSEGLEIAVGDPSTECPPSKRTVYSKEWLDGHAPERTSTENHHSAPEAVAIKTFHVAAAHNDVARCAAMIQSGLDPDCRDDLGHTALHFAAKWGCVEVVNMLLAEGADPDARLGGGSTPLHSLTGCGDSSRTPAIAASLMAAGTNVNAVDNTGRTALHLVALTGDAALAECLLSRGADPNAVDSNGDTALHLAAERGNVTVTECLLSHGAKPNAARRGCWLPGASALHLAAEKGNVALVEGLLSHGANPNAVDGGRGTPLHVAAASNQATPERLRAVAGLLVGARADLNAVYWGGRTALRLAVIRGNVAVAECLLSHGVDPNAPDGAGNAVLHLAAENGSAGLAEFLLSCGANPNIRGRHGQTALHAVALGRAIHDQKLAVAQILVGAGTDINAVDDDGRTALYLVQQRGNTELSQFLLSQGAEVTSDEQCLQPEEINWDGAW